MTLARLLNWFNPWAEETRQLVSPLDRSTTLNAVLDTCAQGKVLRRDQDWFSGSDQLIVRSPFGMTRASVSIDSQLIGSVLTVKLFSPPLWSGALTLLVVAALGLTALGTIQNGVPPHAPGEVLGPLVLTLAVLAVGNLWGRSGARKLVATIAKITEAKPRSGTAGDMSARSSG